MVQSNTTRPGRPGTVVWSGLAVMTLAGMQACRGALWLGLWHTWQEVPLARSPVLLAGLSLGWAGVLSVWVWGWWQGKPWAWRIFPGISLGYVLYQWLDRLVLSVSPLVGHDTPYVLLRSVVVLLLGLYVWWHPATRDYFGVRR